MKVYLDDERNTPDGWVRTYSPLETIELLINNDVTHLSLDHDLGDDENIGTGYDVLIWLEEMVFVGDLYKTKELPVITIHSMNPVGRARMGKLVEAIKKKVIDTKN